MYPVDFEKYELAAEFLRMMLGEETEFIVDGERDWTQPNAFPKSLVSIGMGKVLFKCHDGRNLQDHPTVNVWISFHIRLFIEITDGDGYKVVSCWVSQQQCKICALHESSSVKQYEKPIFTDEQLRKYLEFKLAEVPNSDWKYQAKPSKRPPAPHLKEFCELCHLKKCLYAKQEEKFYSNNNRGRQVRSSGRGREVVESNSGEADVTNTFAPLQDQQG